MASREAWSAVFLEARESYCRHEFREPPEAEDRPRPISVAAHRPLPEPMLAELLAELAGRKQSVLDEAAALVETMAWPQAAALALARVEAAAAPSPGRHDGGPSAPHGEEPPWTSGSERVGARSAT